MNRRHIYVLVHGQQWKVQCDHCLGKVIAVTNTQTEAIKFARAHVANLPEGTLSQILVQGKHGEWITEWTYGEDPFPPSG